MNAVVILGKEHELAFKEFLARLQQAGIDKLFHPHAFTSEIAHKLCHRTGEDEYFILIEHERIVAYGMLRGWDDGYKIPSLGLCIDPAEQRKGYGTFMMHHLIAAAKSKNSPQIMLTVKMQNQVAIALYRKFGFEFTPLDNSTLKGLLAF